MHSPLSFFIFVMSTLFFDVLIPGIFRTPLNSSRILWMSCCLFILCFSDAIFYARWKAPIVVRIRTLRSARVFGNRLATQTTHLPPQILKKRSRRSEGGQIVQELNSICEGKYWDDAKGGWLDPVLVRKAREEEMQYVKKHAVYEKVPMSQCWKEMGKNPIKTGWTDTNKGTSECPNIRSRWVAKEYNIGPRPDLFSATSPLEGLKLVISEAASSNQKETVLLS